MTWLVERQPPDGDVVCQQVPQESLAALTREIDNRHVRDVEDPRVAAHGVVFFFLRAVMQRHVPAAEVDDARVGGDVLVV